MDSFDILVELTLFVKIPRRLFWENKPLKDTFQAHDNIFSIYDDFFICDMSVSFRHVYPSRLPSVIFFLSSEWYFCYS